MRFRVESGCFFYQKNRPILENINFEAADGDMLAVLGANGVGKTTLLRCMTGILRWKAGNTLLDGENIAGMHPRKLWSRMAYVPQAKTPSAAYTVLEMVLLGRSSHLRWMEAPGQSDVEKAMAVLEFLGIASLADQTCSKISGGELQMTLIARALAAEPEVLILDEPEANLDFKNQLVVLDILSELAKKGMTCIFNTHDPAHALQRANKSLLLYRDGGYAFGKTEEVLTTASIRKALGVETVFCDTEYAGDVIKSVVPVRLTQEKEQID